MYFGYMMEKKSYVIAIIFLLLIFCFIPKAHSMNLIDVQMENCSSNPQASHGVTVLIGSVKNYHEGIVEIDGVIYESIIFQCTGIMLYLMYSEDDGEWASGTWPIINEEMNFPKDRVGPHWLYFGIFSTSFVMLFIYEH